MKQKYKVFLKNHLIEFVPEDLSESGSSKKEPDISEYNLLKLWKEPNPVHYLKIRSPFPESAFIEFINRFKVIEACGGIVKIKGLDIYLLIKRLGVWDLPKGKKDPGETDEQTAIREVKEECGLDDVTIEGFVDISFHLFHQNGKFKVKKTSWFEMECPSALQLHPQSEEEITEAIWADASMADKLLQGSYQSIWNLWQTFRSELQK